MVEYRRASKADELDQVLELQGQNLPTNLSPSEREKEGFVTVSHTLDLLKEMNAICPHILAKDKTKVVGYALCMHPKFSDEIELLKPMFSKIESILPGCRSYMVMGQICIDRPFRGKGVFRGLYEFYRAELKDDYDVLVTEVASNNERSLRAHKHMGFETIGTYSSHAISWELLRWDWNVGYTISQ